MNFENFMKKNKKTRENVFYPATKSLCDENGNPLMWELKAISTKENDRIRESCTMEVPVKGKPNQYREKMNTSTYINKMMCAAIVFPDLNNKDLQDSYGVMSAEDLLKELVDDAGEYSDLMEQVQKISGFTTLQEDVDYAKN